MKTYFAIIFALLFACNRVEKPEEIQTGEGHEASTPIGQEYPIKDAKQVFTVKITPTNYTQAQKDKLAKAEILLAKVMNSPEFKQAVLAHPPFTHLVKNKAGMTNQQIWEDIFRGAEALLPAVNYQMDLTVTMYFKMFSRVVGWTTPNSMIVNTHSKYHNTFTPCQVAGNLFHEWLHKMGYDHKDENDLSSVPYALGSLMVKHCNLVAE